MDSLEGSQWHKTYVFNSVGAGYSEYSKSVVEATGDHLMVVAFIEHSLVLRVAAYDKEHQ